MTKTEVKGHSSIYLCVLMNEPYILLEIQRKPTHNNQYRCQNWNLGTSYTQLAFHYASI